MEPVLKTGGQKCLVGSNPTPSASGWVHSLFSPCPFGLPSLLSSPLLLSSLFVSLPFISSSSAFISPFPFLTGFPPSPPHRLGPRLKEPTGVGRRSGCCGVDLGFEDPSDGLSGLQDGWRHIPNESFGQPPRTRRSRVPTRRRGAFEFWICSPFLNKSARRKWAQVGAAAVRGYPAGPREVFF
jgi:hypothetical protein